MPTGWRLVDNTITDPNGGSAGGATLSTGTNTSKIFISPSLKGAFFGGVNMLGNGIVHETIHAYHRSKGFSASYYNTHSESAASTYAYLKAYNSKKGASFYLKNIKPYPQEFSWKNLPKTLNSIIISIFLLPLKNEYNRRNKSII